MKQRDFKVTFAIFFAGSILLLIPLNSFASDPQEPVPGMEADDVAITGSAASFDQRLPPVIPGEEIQHNGKRTRVWSTSGPVAVGPVPAAPVPPGTSNLAGGLPNLGVIVDNRPQNQDNHSGHRR